MDLRLQATDDDDIWFSMPDDTPPEKLAKFIGMLSALQGVLSKHRNFKSIGYLAEITYAEGDTGHKVFTDQEELSKFVKESTTRTVKAFEVFSRE